MKIHMVKQGDTLYLIAKKYNVPLEEIIKANPEIGNPEAIDIGMKVKIPSGAKSPFEVMHQHIVQQGDTLWKLSKAWGIQLADLVKANPQLKNPNALLTGEVVNIPKAGSGGNPGGTMTAQGKKNTGMLPGAGGKTNTGIMPVPAPMPMPVPTPMPVPIPAPVSPAVEMPKPVMPVQEKQKYYEPASKDLFMQYPVPAVEAGAYADKDHVSPYSYGPDNNMVSPDMYGKDHVSPYSYGPDNNTVSPDMYGKDLVSPYSYGPDNNTVSPDMYGKDLVSPYSYGPDNNMVSPDMYGKDHVSPYSYGPDNNMVSPDMYGKDQYPQGISPLGGHLDGMVGGLEGGLHGGIEGGFPGGIGMLPGMGGMEYGGYPQMNNSPYAPTAVSPAMMGYPSDCNCGKPHIMPAYGAQNVSPSMNMGYPGGMHPDVAHAAMSNDMANYPNYGMAGIGNPNHPVSPYSNPQVSPYSNPQMSPYPNHPMSPYSNHPMYPGMNEGNFVSPAETMPTSTAPMPMPMPMPMPPMDNKGYIQPYPHPYPHPYAQPYPHSHYGGIPPIPPFPPIPPMPPLGPLTDGYDRSHSDDEDSFAPAPRKRASKTKLKLSAPARSSKPKRKQSLPWIKP